MDNIHTLVKIARLYYMEELNQQQIATKLNLSKMKIHRLLLKAKEEGIVEIQINEPAEEFSELEIEIEKKFRINECIVVPTSDSQEKTFETMAAALSEIFERELKDGMYIGFGWGTTLRGIAENIRFNNKIKVRVIPLVGGFGSSKEKLHANSIISIIAEKIGGEGYALNCPAIVESEDVRNIFMKEKIIKDVFAMAKHVHTAVVSIGYLGSDMTIRKANLLQEEELKYLMGLGLIGDVNANFINKNGEGVANRIQNKIINIDLGMLSEIKNVIGIAFGVKKAQVIGAALKNRIIDTLITDKQTAESVL